MKSSINQLIQKLTEENPLQPFWSNLLAQIQAQALQVALQKNLFDHLTEFTNSQQLATSLYLHFENFTFFLQLLSSMQLLETRQVSSEQTTEYRNTDVSTRYFCSNSPEYCGDAFKFRYQIVASVVSQLFDFLSQDFERKKIAQTNIAQAWAKAAQLQIAQEQKAISVAIANTLANLVIEFRTAEQFLDIGGGAGLISRHFASLFPELHCTLLEFPAVIQAIQHELTQTEINQQLHFIAADIQNVDLNKSYDIIWCSSVLHFVDDYQLTLKKIYDALNVGGVLICAHSEIDPLNLDPQVQSYYFNMRVQGNFVPHKGEIAATLVELGCSNIQTIDAVQFPVAPLNVIIARK